jgi:putative hydrolase of the HAD superfamily
MRQAILFDLFGTLVDYTPRLQGKDFSGTYAVLARHFPGAPAYADFLRQIEQLFAQFDRESAQCYEEFSMAELFERYLETVCPAGWNAAQRDELVESYTAEWLKSVSWDDGLQALLANLKTRFKLGLVTNTHHQPMVESLLRSIGIHDSFDVILTSVAHGWRKPHPSIFLAAADALEVMPSRCLFVGDSLEADVAGAAAVGMAPVWIKPKDGAQACVPRSVRSVFELAALPG